MDDHEEATAMHRRGEFGLDEPTQADGDLRLVPDAEPEQYQCWDCGTMFTPTSPNQRECVRCYVQGKL